MKLSITLFLTILSILLINTGHACEKAGQADWIYIKGVVSEIEKSPKTKRQLNPKVAKKNAADKEVIGLLRNFRFLNKKLVKTKKGSNRLVKKYLVQYSKLERRADSFAATSGNNEGIGACMSECGDYFPGTGGGNGINRVACKIGCLAHGG